MQVLKVVGYNTPNTVFIIYGGSYPPIFVPEKPHIIKALLRLIRARLRLKILRPKLRRYYALIIWDFSGTNIGGY